MEVNISKVIPVLVHEMGLILKMCSPFQSCWTSPKFESDLSRWIFGVTRINLFSLESPQWARSFGTLRPTEFQKVQGTEIMEICSILKIPARSNPNWFGHLTFFGHCVSTLARWPQTKSKYLFSLSILGFFLLFAHQNCCNCGVCSKTAIKPTIRGSGRNLWETYFCTFFVCIVRLRWFLSTSVLVTCTPSYLDISMDYRQVFFGV